MKAQQPLGTILPTKAITQRYLVYGTTSMYTQIKGVATDGYVTAECIFYTELDTGLKANVQNDTVNVVYDETSQLVVNASSDYGNISYQWYYYDNYYVGDKLKLKLKSASKDTRKIDFTVVGKISESDIVSTIRNVKIKKRENT